MNCLPIIIDNDEAQAVHLLFAQQILAQNVNLFQADKQAILKTCNRILEVDEQDPEREILCDQGRQLLQQASYLLNQ